MNEIRQATARSQEGWADAAGLAAENFAAHAERAGLLDLAYTEVDSPIGKLVIAVTPRGLARLALPNEASDEVLARLARDISPRVLRVPSRLDDIRRQLDDYFDGRLTRFKVRVDLHRLPSFQRSILQAAKAIPYGKVSTYTRVADKAGRPAAVRAAGNALGANPVPIVVPCHRVLRSDGSLGGYGGGVDLKRRLLDLERKNS